MTYQILLFDADGTLLDFKKSEEVGLKQVFLDRNLPFTEEMRSYYVQMNAQLWKDFESGAITRQHIFDVRFQRLLDAFGVEGDGTAFEQAYRTQLNKGSHLIPQAKEICEELAKQYRMYIITNGVSHTQYQRLHDAGLEPYFIHTFVSEDIGYQKPQIEYFEHVLSQIDGDPSSMLVIGDSLTSDILGANRAHLDSCWFNPEKGINASEAKPTYEIEKLEDLWKLL